MVTFYWIFYVTISKEKGITCEKESYLLSKQTERCILGLQEIPNPNKFKIGTDKQHSSTLQACKIHQKQAKETNLKKGNEQRMLEDTKASNWKLYRNLNESFL